MLFFFGVYYDFLISISRIFKPLDELFYLLLIPYIAINYKWFSKINRAQIIKRLLIIVLLIGFYGSYKYKYQSLLISLAGGLVYFKSFVPYLFVLFFLDKNILNKQKLYKSIKGNFVFSLVIIILGILYQFIFAPWSIYWKGPFPQLVSVFSPDATYGVVVAFLGLVFYYMHQHAKQSKVLFWVLMLLIIVSFRVKALFFTGVVILFMYSKKRIFSARMLLFFPLVFAFFSIKPIRDLLLLKIDHGFSKSTHGDIAARAALTYTSFQVAKDHFPTGSGFATFGTHFSGVHYSPLYKKYGISKVYGLTKKDHSFINDTQWPPILAETGFVGLIVFILLLYFMYRNSIEGNKRSKTESRSISLCFILLFIHATGTPVFFNSISASIYTLIAILSFQPKMVLAIEETTDNLKIS